MTVLDKNILATGSFLMAVTIAIGAFGAHGLKELLDASALQSFEVGVRYQIYHALAILGLGIATGVEQRLKKRIFCIFIVGIFLFSGSIYLLSLSILLPFKINGIGFLTPLGGLLFIIGWVLFAYEMLSLKKR